MAMSLAEKQRPHADGIGFAIPQAASKNGSSLGEGAPFARGPEWVSHLAVEAARQLASGGFTVHPSTGTKPVTGFQVAEVGATHFEDAASLEGLPEHELATALETVLSRVLVEHRDRYVGHPDVCVGGWIETGLLWLEPSDHVPTLEEARSLGAARNQRTVWDNANCIPIHLGGTHASGEQAATG